MGTEEDTWPADRCCGCAGEYCCNCGTGDCPEVWPAENDEGEE